MGKSIIKKLFEWLHFSAWPSLTRVLDINQRVIMLMKNCGVDTPAWGGWEAPGHVLNALLVA